MSERRVVLVSGGSRGLGLAMANTLVRDGFKVVAVARKSSPELDEAIAAAPDCALGFRACDLADVEALQPLVREVRTAFGPIYGLVNNAGLGTPGMLATMPTEEILRLVQLNTVAPMLLTKFAMRGMMASGAGRIVNISSIIATTGFNALSVYAATKASMIGFTRSLARELAPFKVNVNAVCPGVTKTRVIERISEEIVSKIRASIPLGFFAEPEDIAAVAAFLASDDARYMTGQSVVVDGGRWMV